MAGSTLWLPRPTYQERALHRRALIALARQKPVVYFSEFLNAGQVRFFAGRRKRIDVLEALVSTLPGRDGAAVLQALLEREREGGLGIRPDIHMMRGRMAAVHHIRAALGLCPEGIFDPSGGDALARILILLVGPVNQTALHMGLLVSISSLFHRRPFVEKVLRLRSAERVCQAMRLEESHERRVPMGKKLLQRVMEFFRVRYGWGEAPAIED